LTADVQFNKASTRAQAAALYQCSAMFSDGLELRLIAEKQLQLPLTISSSAFGGKKKRQLTSRWAEAVDPMGTKWIVDWRPPGQLGS
jgi:hypothetical protein